MMDCFYFFIGVVIGVVVHAWISDPKTKKEVLDKVEE
jgi:hypothetical protein